jgi:hypothetical protein
MFKQRKPRGFDLKGRYFDENKARRDNILRKKDEVIPFDDKEKYRERLRQNWEHRRATGTSKNFGMRIIIIFGILVALLYALFYIF